METKRNNGIDLLRLVLMFMICVLHVLGQGGVLNSCIVGSIEYKVYWFLEIFCLCAVDTFALISGYTATDKPRKYEKLINMWFQVFFYSFIITAIFAVAGVFVFDKKELIKNIFPITFKAFWYMTAYFALFLAMPMFNAFLFKLEEKSAKKWLVVIVVIYGIMGSIIDTFHTNWGYSALWLMVLYCIGALAKRVKLFEKKKTSTLIVIWIISVVLNWILYICSGKRMLIEYICPTMLLNAVIMVILFSRMKLNGKIISKLYPYALGVYLFQLNTVIWNVYLIGRASFIVNEGLTTGIVVVFTYASILFIAGLVVECIRSKVAKLIHIPELSKKIVVLLDKILNYVIRILK